LGAAPPGDRAQLVNDLGHLLGHRLEFVGVERDRADLG
jgi:hypothetical protein